MSPPYFQAVAITTSYYTVNLNGDVTTFSQSSSASATGTNADQTAKQATSLSQTENFMLAHTKLASIIVKEPTQVANWSNISNNDKTELIVTVIN